MQNAWGTVCRAVRIFNSMTETNPIDEIKPVLAALLQVVLSGPKDNTEGYVEALKKLDAYTKAEFKQRLPWDLWHYLSNRSYLKALNFIDSWESKS